MNTTHPDILKMERDGYLGKEPAVIYKCSVCGDEIYEGDEYLDINGDDGEAVCCACDREYMKQFIKVAERILEWGL